MADNVCRAQNVCIAHGLKAGIIVQRFAVKQKTVLARNHLFIQRIVKYGKCGRVERRHKLLPQAEMILPVIVKVAWEFKVQPVPVNYLRRARKGAVFAVYGGVAKYIRAYGQQARCQYGGDERYHKSFFHACRLLKI